MKRQKLLFKKTYIPIALCSLSIYGILLNAYEQIISFDSTITVNKDASMSVQETIIYDTDKDDRHGITREFPTVYKDNQGALYNVGFEIKDIMLNGKPVPFKTEHVENGTRIVIGNPSYYMSPGTHTYTLLYDTNRQLGFFKKHDELYWNVTGTGWRLPINYASARITLPQTVSANAIKTDAYHGYQGSKNRYYQSKIVPDGSIFFETTKPLFPQQGLTIVAGWPKGIVSEPSWLQKAWWLLQDNLALLWLLIGSLVISAYYFLTNRRLKKDVQPGTVIPRFYPPKNMSPGLTRYITKMGYDPKQLAASIVDMAVKGLLTINHKSTVFSNQYTLHKKNPAPAEYKKLQEILFEHGNTTLPITTQNQTIVQKAAQLLWQTYQSTTQGYFKSTALPIIGGYAITAAFFIPTIFLFKGAQNWWYFVTVIMILLLNIIYTTVLAKIYTPQGLTIKEEIDGFKMFLETTEKERFKVIGTPPTKTPELYEKYLPYAIALGVEKQWTRQFASVFERLEQVGTPYQPVWYIGQRPFNIDTMNNFSSNVSTVTQSKNIAASSYAPGSTSGFGRGGYSGGGGGGGGGGSW